jgi:hypothetical protein
LGVSGGGAPQAGQPVQEQASAGLAKAAGIPVDRALVVEGKECLDLPDDLAAGALGVQDLIEKAKEGASQGIDALAAVWALVSL